MKNLRPLRRLVVLSWGFCIGVVCGSARASDFTISVPLELRNLNPAIESARVSCGVYGKIQGTNQLIASDYKDVFRSSFGNGDIVTTLTFELSSRPGMDPALAENYTCDLLLGIKGHISMTQTAEIQNLMRPDGIYPRDATKPFVVSAYGPIPKPKALLIPKASRAAPLPTPH